MLEQIGPYEILEKIGVGGMGTVYRARNTRTGQIVALKVMRPEFAEDVSFIRRFRREATIASSLQSPNIVSFLEVGQQDESPYIAMELVEGQSLASLVRSAGPLPTDQALDIAIQIAQALYAAHEKGVIHRDISPQNILMTRDGIAKITDFGIARSESSATLTGTGTFIGKPSYAPPEVFDGHSDTRSDIYSLGIVLFEMLSGRPPFVSSNPLTTMDMQVRQPPPKLNDLGVRVPPALQQIIDKCLQKSPAQRFQTPRELLQALTRALRGESVDELTRIVPVGAGSGSPPAPPVAAGQGGNRWPMFLAIAAVAAVGLVAVAAVIVAVGQSSNKGSDGTSAGRGTNTTSHATASPAPTATVAVTPVPTSPPVVGAAAPTLVSPAPGQQLPQPAFGSCPTGAVNWTFSWQPSGPGVTSYEINIRQPDGTVFHDEQVPATSYSIRFACNQFVADEQLSNWVWQVRPLNGAGAIGQWSPGASFNVQSRNPCAVFGTCAIKVESGTCINLRPNHTTQPKDGQIWCLDRGTTLRITGGPVSGENYIWWPVEVTTLPAGWGNRQTSGWVAEGEANGTASWFSVIR